MTNPNNNSKQPSLKEWAMAGGGIPREYEGRAYEWHKKVQQFAAGGGIKPAAYIDGNEFVEAAQAYGLKTDNATLNKIVDRVNKGESVREAAKNVAQSHAAGGEIFNTVPDMADGGEIIEDSAYAKGGAVKKAVKDAVEGVVDGLKPMVDRINMHFKDVTKRVPELQEGAQKVKDEEMTRAEYEKLVNKYKPVKPYDFVPKPATRDEAYNALHADKRDLYGTPSSMLKAGHPVGLRLDIPAYSDHGVWVPAVHQQSSGFDAGDRIGYENIAGVMNPTFGMSEKAALNIAAGKPKGTIATIKGNWNPMDEATAIARAQEYLDNPDWAQVGMDPERHGYFYDRRNMKPITAAEEAIQIGPLVLAKKPQYGNKKDFKYAHGGEVHMSKGGKVKEIVKEGLEKLLGKADEAPKGVEPIVVKEKPAKAAKAAKPANYSPKVLESTAARFADKISAANPKMSDEEVAKKAMNQATKKLEWERTQKPALEKRYGDLVASSFAESNTKKQQNTPEVVKERMRKANEFLDQPTEAWKPPKPELQAFDRASIKDALEGFPGVEQSKFPRDTPSRANIEHVEGLYTDPENRALIEKQIKRGLPLGGESFYASLYPVKQAVLEAGMPPEKFERWIHSLAPASARNSIMNEMAAGQFLRDMNARGIPLTEENVAKEMALYKEKFGIGLPLMPLHREGVAKVLEGGQNLRDMNLANIPTNYKIPTYGSQKAGDFANSVVLDVHEAGGQTQGSRYHPYFNEQGGFGNTEYNAGEQGLLGIAQDLGIPGGMAQAGRWFGGGELTGLKSPRGDALDLLEKQVAYTLKQKGVQPNPANVRAEVLRQIETGEGDLLPWYRKEGMPDVRETGLQRAEGGDVHMAGGGEVRMGEGGDPRGEMKAYEPTARERMALALQEGMEKLGANRYKARKNAQTVMGGPSSALPIDMGIADFVPFLGTGLGVDEGARDLGLAYDAAKRGDYIDATANTVGAVMGLAPGAYGTIKGGLKAVELAKKAPEVVRKAESGLNTLTAQARYPFQPAVLTMEGVAPDLGTFKNSDWQNYLTNKLIGEKGAPVNMERMGGKKTEKTLGQGLYENNAGEFESNPMFGVSIPFAGNLSTNKRLLSDIATAGRELNQENVAAHRFVPMLTNQPLDATAMMIMGQDGKQLTKKQILSLAEMLPGMIVSHSPKAGGMFVAPFEGDKLDYKAAQQAARDVLGKGTKIQYGQAKPNRDTMYRGDYEAMGARPPSAESIEMRKRLKAMDASFPRSPSGSPSKPLSGLDALANTAR